VTQTLAVPLALEIWARVRMRAPLDGRGRGVRIAIVDSGVHAAHPHVGGVAGGVAIDEDGEERADFVDRLGHGTAVTAAVHDLAPEAQLLAVRVFERRLSTSVAALVGGIRWAIRHEAQIVNLSLGAAREAHERELSEVVAEAVARGVLLVAAAAEGDVRWLPGSLPGVLGVRVDWRCTRDTLAAVDDERGRTVVRASGYPRAIPGVPPERNLKGVSFAVANTSGLVARLL
jgi:subtilisin family serine protease